MTVENAGRGELNRKLTEHMRNILRCSVSSPRYGRLLLASPPEARYPYIYPRDVNCASQLFRRLAGSPNDYDVADDAHGLLQSMARFLKDVQSEEGNWGQRYSLEGEDKSIYRQEDNLAHGIAVISNYLLASLHRGRDIEDLEGHLRAINRALHHGVRSFYQKELNLFHSTTSIHESALEEGYTCWVNFTFLYAYSLAEEVAGKLDPAKIISTSHRDFRDQFRHSVNELFMSGNRYIRRLDPHGNMDLRPDFTLLSPFYYGFLRYEKEMDASVAFIEKQLWDPEFGMIMRYLPFYKDFAVHVHAGNGPWLQYTAILAQYHYWKGNIERGDQLLAAIDKHRGENGEIPEHLSTCARFEEFMKTEWKTGIDFDKEFHRPLLLDDVDFDKILEEANNMARAYQETGSKCMVTDSNRAEGGYIQFAMPLMWSHAEYSRALLFRARDWWRF